MALINEPLRIDGPKPGPPLLLVPCLGEEPHEHHRDTYSCVARTVGNDPVPLARRARR